MTYKECVIMLEGLKAMDQVNPAILHTRLTYAVAKNLRELIGINEDLQAKLRESEGFKSFLSAKTELLMKHAERDKNGFPMKETIETNRGLIDHYIIKGGSGQGSPFAQDLEKLKVLYKKEIEERNKQIDDYNEFLDTESEFEPKLITPDLLPDKGIPQQAMNGLVFMIKEGTNKSFKKKCDEHSV